MPLSLLVVEDTEADARLMEITLQESPVPCSITHCATMEAAIAQLRQAGQVDLVVLDLGLPDSTGLDTFVTLKTHAPDVPVMVMIGHCDNAAALEAVRMGAEDYLVKGESTEQLVARIGNHTIEKARLRQQQQQYLNSLHSDFDALQSLIVAHPLPHLLLDRRGQVLTVNLAAEALLQDDHRFHVGQQLPVGAGDAMILMEDPIHEARLRLQLIRAPHHRSLVLALVRRERIHALNQA
ncbi:MAG: response regulator [Bacteroidota bacterium]